MKEAPIKVALIDDHAMVREALASVLNASGAIEIAAQGGSTQDALRIVREFEPDVLVLDYNMPGGGALPVLEALRSLRSVVRVLVLTVHDSWHYAVRVLEAGANGFMIKASAVEELQEAIQRISGGEIYITPNVSHKVLDHLRRPRVGRTGVSSLSQREFEVLCALGEGMGIKDAASKLNISISAASTYRTRVLKKLNLESTNELIRFVIEHSIVD